MNISSLQGKATRMVVDNAEAILTAGGVIGTVATALLTGKASFKAANVILDEDLKFIKSELENTLHDPDVDEGAESFRDTMGLTTRSKAALVWKYYVPPVIVGSATVVSVIAAHRISVQRAAALAAAYGVLDNRFDEYREKVSEKLTGPKKEALDTEIAQKHVDENPASKQVVIVAGGDVLCYDLMSGRYFRSSVEQIKRAEAELNHQLFDSQICSLSDFYDNIGLPRTLMSDMLGWTAFVEGAITINLSTTLSEDKQPCLVLDYSRTPEPNFTRIVE